MSNSASRMDDAYQAVRRRLLQGPPGRLSRRALAEELGVSQACVQAALGRLEGEGLLETRPQSGTRVRLVDMDEYHRLYDLRELLESYAARRAAGRATPAHLDRVDRSVAALVAHADAVAAGGASPSDAEVARGIAIEHTFHGTVLDAADNPTAHRFVENLRILSYYSRFFARAWSREVLTARLRVAAAEHAAVADALRRRHPADAERLMRDHIRMGRARPDHAPPPDEPPTTCPHPHT